MTVFIAQRFKLIARDFAEAHTLAGAQKCRWIFFGVEQPQRCATDEIPAAWGTQRINSRLGAANPDRTGRDLFSRYVPSRCSQLLWKTSQKWKSGNKPYAGYAILSAAVKPDDFTWRDTGASRNIIDVEREFRIIADWNFDQADTALCSCAVPAAVSARGYSSANARRQPIEHLVRCFSVFGDWNRIEEDCDACVGRREFNYTGDGGVLKLLKCAKNCVQCLLRRIIESLAHTNDQSGISEGYDFHHSVIPSEVEESRGAADGISTGSFDFAALRSEYQG
jgi:hypothetical protein